MTQIVSDRGADISFLVLDEALGNLSEKNRDALVRLVHQVLNRLFRQIMMVSHTLMRDVFKRTVHVSAENGVSTVEVM